MFHVVRFHVASYRLCADAVQKKGWNDWEEQRDLKKFTLKDAIAATVFFLIWGTMGG